MIITKEMQQPLLEIQKEVKMYKENKDTFDPKDIQSIRDNLALNLFYCADLYSSLRSSAEAADYIRKREVAKEEERLREEAKENGSKITNGEIANKARINTASIEDELVEANRKYNKIRKIVYSCNQILNSISSRINQIK